MSYYNAWFKTLLFNIYEIIFQLLYHLDNLSVHIVQEFNFLLSFILIKFGNFSGKRKCSNKKSKKCKRLGGVCQKKNKSCAGVKYNKFCKGSSCSCCARE